MNIYYDKDKTEEVNQRIWEKWGNREKKDWAVKGYNVSECSNCEMKCYSRRTGIEQKVTRQGIGFLVFGIISEFVCMSIYPKEECQYEMNLNELVWGHLDAYEKLSYPIEGKATAKRIFKAKDLPVNWVMQLINYITMGKGYKGWLYILDIFTRTLSAFCVEITQDEKLLQIQVLMDKVAKFDKAIPAKDTSSLTINPEEYDLCGYKKECLRRDECKRENAKLKKEKK